MQTNNFKLILLVIFIGSAIFGMLTFADVIKIGKDKEAEQDFGTVNIWGTLDSNSVIRVLREVNRQNQNIRIRYTQKSKESFEVELLEAVSKNQSPDLFLITEDMIFSLKDRIQPYDYVSYPPSFLKSYFIEAGEILMSQNGLYALPIAIDPLVLYYNRTILNNKDFVYPPSFWEDFPEYVKKITERNENNQISKTAFALGQFANVNHAKEILSALFLQSGSKIIKQVGDNSLPDFTQGGRRSINPGVLSAFKFYLSFADPLSPVYTWNRSLPNSRDYFSAENLAFYFGFASELDYLKEKNPNQNFFVASLPQVKNATKKVTYAHVLGLAVSVNAKNKAGASFATPLLVNGYFAEELSRSESLVPTRRDLIAKKQEDPFMSVFYSSALSAQSWLDPNYQETQEIFKNMVEGVLSNEEKPEASLLSASNRIESLLK